MAAVTIHSDFEAQESKICYCFHFFPSICHEVMGVDAVILVFLIWSFKPAFSLSPFTLIKHLFSFSLLFAKCGIICISEVFVISPGYLDFNLWFIQTGILRDVLYI